MIVDCHVHPNVPLAVGVDEGRRILERGLNALAAEGIEACAGSLWEPLNSDCANHREQNDLLAALARDEPRFWPCCVVNPRTPDAADEVRRCAGVHGIRALKLHPWLQGFSCSDAYTEPVYRACADVGMAIIFHDGTPPYSSTLQCADVARRHPDLTVILGHSGLNDQWQQARDIACEWPNVCLALSGPSMLAMQSIVDRVRAEQIMYGSDYTWGDTGIIRYRLHKVQALAMSDEARRLVLSGTALRVFGMPPC